MKKSTLRWESKGSIHDKTYKTKMGTTDYDIPMFSFKSAAFIFIVIFMIMNFIPPATSYIMKDPRMANILICSPLSGWSIGFAQYFINSKKGYGKGFMITSAFFTLLSILILFLIYYGGVLA